MKFKNNIWCNIEKNSTGMWPNERIAMDKYITVYFILFYGSRDSKQKLEFYLKYTVWWTHWKALVRFGYFQSTSLITVFRRLPWVILGKVNLIQKMKAFQSLCPQRPESVVLHLLSSIQSGLLQRPLPTVLQLPNAQKGQSCITASASHRNQKNECVLVDFRKTEENKELVHLSVWQVFWEAAHWKKSKMMSQSYWMCHCMPKLLLQL